MDSSPYPNWKRGLWAGCIGGAVAGVLWFALCLWVASLPAVTVVSLSWSVRPWWRLSNWVESLCCALVGFLIVGALAACWPKRRKEQHETPVEE